MSTKLVDKLYIEKENLVKLLNINELYKKVCTLLDQRWVEMVTYDFIYDHRIAGCYLNPGNIQRLVWNEECNISELYNVSYTLDLFTKDEMKKAFSDRKAPIEWNKKRVDFYDSSFRCFIQCKYNYSMDFDYFSISNSTGSGIIPLYRIDVEDSAGLSYEETFKRWVKNGLVPKALAQDERYRSILGGEIIFDENGSICDFVSESGLSLDLNKLGLLNEDKVRADLDPYNDKIVEDTEQGHWSLWNSKREFFNNPIEINLDKQYVARDPSSSIIDGVVGIDFGTKSTVVVYQEDSDKVLPMRVGTGSLKKEVDNTHYENPTILEFNRLEKFMDDYTFRVGRPYTSWEDVTVSHTAFNSLMESKTDDYNAYVNELKQWAGNRNKKLKIMDKESFMSDLNPFIELSENDINPIEIYAYYLGLYINNLHNGIYLDYILSFPVTYEMDIRDKIIESFRKGIKKALPLELHNQPEYLESLNITKGASEPAAYAVIALQEYGFNPTGDEKVFYGIFDFGGGTTDFDFGVWREAVEESIEEDSYENVIEHFGAGGDRYLGGENLLELLAFNVFKANKEKLLQQGIQFSLPPECDKFPGSETLLSNSREAKMNMVTLMEELRPFWERHENYQDSFNSGSIMINIADNTGKKHANYELDVDEEELTAILKSRIHKGVKSFFEDLRLAFSNEFINLNHISEINIFLAGNSSKSELVKEIFYDAIEQVSSRMKESLSIEGDIFTLFPPLGTYASKKNMEERGISVEIGIEKPTGKTGVAYGLIETRKGGTILVKDYNVQDDIKFKYYLGRSKKKKFDMKVSRGQEYNEWVPFVRANSDTFEIYYTSLAIASTGSLEISDTSIKKKRLKVDIEDSNGFISIKLISPTEIEYGVIIDNEPISQVKRVSLS